MVGAVANHVRACERVALLEFEGYAQCVSYGRTIDRGTVTDSAAPQVHTTLADADGNHVVPAGGVVTLVDTVEYNDVRPGTEYTLYGELYDKATGESLGITSSATFTPTQPYGSTEVTFEVDTDALQGTALVAFEELFMWRWR